MTLWQAPTNREYRESCEWMRFAETSGFLPAQMPNFRSFHAEQGAATVRNDKPNQSPIGSDPTKALVRPRHTIP
jgi:hypothetical protein